MAPYPCAVLSPGSPARRRAGRLYRAARRLPRAIAGRADFWTAPDEDAVRLAYGVLLRRAATPEETSRYAARLKSGSLNRHQLVDELVGSDEFAVSTVFGSDDLGPSLHFSRGIFVRGLPAARRILDLGGTHRTVESGALVAMGYPHPFDALVVVDLPPEDRHAIYRTDELTRDVVTHLGPVTYRYHSMVDLDAYDDESFDLVYSGQSIEHVTPADADRMLAGVRRVLRPGGWLAVDTPNGRVCRLQQPDHIDPDHKVEYTHEEMVAKLTAAGFELVDAHGLNNAAFSLAAGTFSPGHTSRAWGLVANPADGYLLAYLCRAP